MKQEQIGKKGGIARGGVAKTATAAAAGAILGGIVGAVAAHPRTRKKIINTVSNIRTKAVDLMKDTGTMDDMKEKASDTVDDLLEGSKEKKRTTSK